MANQSETRDLNRDLEGTFNQDYDGDDKVGKRDGYKTSSSQA